MTLDLSKLPTIPAPVLVWALFTVLTWLYLRRELTPRAIVSLFESEKSLSIRLVLATVVVLFTLFMQAAGRLDSLKVEANYTFAAILLGLGAAKIVGKAFAERPPDTTVNAKKADNININQPPVE